MRRVLITGAAGFLGRALVRCLAGGIGTRGATVESGHGATVEDGAVQRLVLVDRHIPENADGAGGASVEWLRSDLSDAPFQDALAQADAIVHLAAILTRDAEGDPSASYDVNLERTMRMIAAAGPGARRPRFVFASSMAVFGPSSPRRVVETTPVGPRTAYGTQKAMIELALADATRRGVVDAVSARLPFVIARPGPPGTAISDLGAEIVRGPLAGRRVVSPLDPDAPLPFVSGEAVARGLATLLTTPLEAYGERRLVHHPGLEATPRDVLEVLRKEHGDAVADRVTFEPDPAITEVVSGWPTSFETEARTPLSPQADVADLLADVLAGLRAG